MLVLRIDKPQTSDDVKALFNHADQVNIGCVNWSSEFPDKPEVNFSMFHDGDTIYLHYTVSERYTLAKVESDNGEVWTDSCVEFFLKLDDSGYYNFEFTAIGKGLVGFRQDKNNACRAEKEVMLLIKRTPSLGYENFDEKQNCNWDITLEIPKEALFAHKLKTLSGLKATANLYKCGDNLTKPHFISWQPIDNATPNFHLTEFFGELEFV